MILSETQKALYEDVAKECDAKRKQLKKNIPRFPNTGQIWILNRLLSFIFGCGISLGDWCRNEWRSKNKTNLIIHTLSKMLFCFYRHISKLIQIVFCQSAAIWARVARVSMSGVSEFSTRSVSKNCTLASQWRTKASIQRINSRPEGKETKLILIAKLLINWWVCLYNMFCQKEKNNILVAAPSERDWRQKDEDWVKSKSKCSKTPTETEQGPNTRHQKDNPKSQTTFHIGQATRRRSITQKSQFLSWGLEILTLTAGFFPQKWLQKVSRFSTPVFESRCPSSGNGCRTTKPKEPNLWQQLLPKIKFSKKAAQKTQTQQIFLICRGARQVIAVARVRTRIKEAVQIKIDCTAVDGRLVRTRERNCRRAHYKAEKWITALRRESSAD